MGKLKRIGFCRVGFWFLNNNKLTVKLKRYADRANVLYAFVCDGKVKYIGKTTRTLKTRMQGYQTPSSSQTTNLKNHKNIKQLLKKGKKVFIFALIDKGRIRYGKLAVNLAEGLEGSLLSFFQPKWNDIGKYKSKPTFSILNKNIKGRSWLRQLLKYGAIGYIAGKLLSLI